MSTVNEVGLWVPFEKGMIDVEKRMVYGIAQLEEAAPDLQGDIVDFEATKRAFAKWGGNVREMHRKDLAVGKALFIKPIEETKQMLVGVRVSKGAESTWQKVLDGTLSGFSIGGFATRTKKYFDNRLGRWINKVLDYTLRELSLVDTPANPRCKIVGIQKNLVAPGLAGDVPSKGAIVENKALEAIVEMAKQVGPDDELILLRKSDMNVVEHDGVQVITLNGDADVSDVIKGADLAEIDGNVGGGGSFIVDGIAALAKGLAELCKSAGLDPVATFTEAVVDEEAIGKGLGSGMSRSEIVDLVKDAVGSGIDARLDTLTSVVEDLQKSVNGGALAPRRGTEGTGTPQARPITKMEGGDEGEGQSRETIQKSLKELRQKRDGFIAKMDSGQKLSDTERVEADAIGKQIDHFESMLAGGRINFVSA